MAHSDKRYFLHREQIAKDYPLTFGDAEKLINFADVVCNTFLSNLNHEKMYCKSQNADDLKNLLVSIKEK